MQSATYRNSSMFLPKMIILSKGTFALLEFTTQKTSLACLESYAITVSFIEGLKLLSTELFIVVLLSIIDWNQSFRICQGDLRFDENFPHYFKSCKGKHAGTMSRLSHIGCVLLDTEVSLCSWWWCWCPVHLKYRISELNSHWCKGLFDTILSDSSYPSPRLKKRHKPYAV